MSQVLKTDAYEFTMLQSLIDAGFSEKPATFELFARKIPEGRDFGLVAGLGRFLDLYKDWRITFGDIAFLKENNLIKESGQKWLTKKALGKLFNGNIYSYREGDVYFPYSPIVRVESTLGEAILLETLLLSIFNFDSAVASAAAYMKIAAGDKKIIEMGTRRAEDSAALSASRAAYLAGFASTSNVEAARKYGIPTAGTAAHAFTLAHAKETDAFLHQMQTWGTGTTLLVDTYDTHEGIAKAVTAAKTLGSTGPGAIRIDSGDLKEEVQKARALLDELGATETKIVVSSDLNRALIESLSESPVDVFGVGTQVVTGDGYPTAGMVYKLVEIDGVAVAKKSASKISIGGVKTPYRVSETEEFNAVGNDSIPNNSVLPQRDFIKNGEIVRNYSLSDSRRFALKTINRFQELKELRNRGL